MSPRRSSPHKTVTKYYYGILIVALIFSGVYSYLFFKPSSNGSSLGTLQCYAFDGSREVEASVQIQKAGVTLQVKLTPFSASLAAGSYSLIATYETIFQSKNVEISLGQTQQINFYFSQTPVEPVWSFNKYFANPIIIPSTSWDSHAIESMSVPIKDGNQWVIYYEQWGDLCWTIGMATSVDGVSWTKATSPVISVLDASSGNTGACDPAPFKDVNGWKMWYVYRASSSVEWALGYATSSNGRNWVQYSDNPVLTVPGWGVFEPYVIKIDGKLRLYYQAWNHIWLAEESSDGIHWINNHEIYAPSWALSPFIIKPSGSEYYWLFYTLWTGSECQIRVAKSSYYDQGFGSDALILRPTEPWENGWVLDARVLEIQPNKFYMYYCGASAFTNRARTGLATYDIAL